MARTSPGKIAKVGVPGGMGDAEFEALILSIAQLLRDAKSIDDRRNLVMILDGQGLRRSEIFKLIGKAFDVDIKTIDKDLAHVRDYWNNYCKGMTRANALATVMKHNQEILRRAMAQGDLGNANRAVATFAEVTHLKEPSQGDAGAPSFDPAQARELILTRLSKRPEKG